MPFRKNDERINRHGRPKGSRNKSTEEVKRLLTEFINNNIDDLQSEYEKLPAREKLQFFEKVLRYVVPQPSKDEPEEMGGKSGIGYTQEDIEKIEGELYTGGSSIDD